jgi:hypothetical protein
MDKETQRNNVLSAKYTFFRETSFIVAVPQRTDWFFYSAQKSCILLQNKLL